MNEENKNEELLIMLIEVLKSIDKRLEKICVEMTYLADK